MLICIMQALSTAHSLLLHQAIIPAIPFCLHSSFNSTLEGPEGLWAESCPPKAQSTVRLLDSASERCPFSWKFSWLSKTHHSSSLLKGRSRQSSRGTSCAAAGGVVTAGGLPAMHRPPNLTVRPILGCSRICSNSWSVPAAVPPFQFRAPHLINLCPPILSSCALTTVLPLTSPVEFPCAGIPLVRTERTFPSSDLLMAPGRTLVSPPACPQGASPVQCPHLCTPGKCTTPSSHRIIDSWNSLGWKRS